MDAHHFSPQQASIQTLADQTSSYYAQFLISQGGVRSVGVPLLVHRRCTSPMFKIANLISYGGLMVYGRTDKVSAIKNCLGASRWIDVQGNYIGHWSPTEGYPSP